MTSPSSTEANRVQRKNSWLSIRRAMTLAGSIIVLAIAITGVLLSYQTITQNRIGSPKFIEIEKGKDLLADILPPPLMPFEAYSLLHYYTDEDINLFRANERKFAELEAAFFDRLKHWDEELANSPVVDQKQWSELSKKLHENGKDFWRVMNNKALPAIRSGGEAEKVEALRAIAPSFLAMLKLVNENAGPISEQAHAFETENVKTSDDDMRVAIAASVALAVFVALLLLLGQRLVVRAISRISEVMRELASGNLDASIPYAQRGDEIGDMSRALQVFQKQAQQNETQRSDNEFVIHALGGGLKGLSSGNLTCSIEEPFPPELDALRAHFNDAVVSLQQTISSVKDGTDGHQVRHRRHRSGI